MAVTVIVQEPQQCQRLTGPGVGRGWFSRPTALAGSAALKACSTTALLLMAAMLMRGWGSTEECGYPIDER